MDILYQMLNDKNYYQFLFTVIPICIIGYVFLSILSSRYLGLKFKSNGIEAKVVYIIIGLCFVPFASRLIPIDKFIFNTQYDYDSLSNTIFFIMALCIGILECMRILAKYNFPKLKSLLRGMKKFVRRWLLYFDIFEDKQQTKTIN